MAEVSQDSTSSKRRGKRRAKKLPNRIDFTPMVDLGFLLITFFMLATSLIKPQTMEITLPSDKNTEENKAVAKASQAVTLILGKNDKIFYYFGKTEGAQLIETDYTPGGLRKLLLAKNYNVAKQVQDLRAEKDKTGMDEQVFQKKLQEIKTNKNALIVRIMLTDEANYRNMVDALDEMSICSISRYAVVDIEGADLKLIQDRNI